MNYRVHFTGQGASFVIFERYIQLIETRIPGFQVIILGWNSAINIQIYFPPPEDRYSCFAFSLSCLLFHFLHQICTRACVSSSTVFISFKLSTTSFIANLSTLFSCNHYEFSHSTYTKSKYKTTHSTYISRILTFC